jgi:hypothetical protein
VVEGRAAEVTDETERGRLAGTFEAKYGPHSTDPRGTWFGLGDALRSGGVPSYQLTPSKVFSFGKGEVYSQTRYCFD